MCDVCVLAAEASARHESRLRAGARERLARQVIDPHHAKARETGPNERWSGVGRLVALAAHRLVPAASRPQNKPTR